MSGLRRVVPDALDSVSLDTIRKYFRKCSNYNRAYIEGEMTGKDADIKVKEYKPTEEFLQSKVNLYL